MDPLNLDRIVQLLQQFPWKIKAMPNPILRLKTKIKYRASLKGCKKQTLSILNKLLQNAGNDA